MAEREYKFTRIFEGDRLSSWAISKNGSKVSTGGILLYLLAFIAILAGDGTYVVATAPRPRNRKELNAAIDVARSAWVNYGYRDDQKIVAVHIGGVKGWLAPLNNSGFMAWAVGKVIKRLKTFNRPSLLGAEITRDLKILVVDNPLAYANWEVQASAELDTKAKREMLLDGLMVMRRSLLKEVIRKSKFHPTDPLRAMLQKARALRNMIFNIRITCRLGFAKGNVVVGDDDAMGEYDLIIPAMNIKQEITSTRQFIILDPQPPKDHVRTDPQTMIDNRKLHRQADMGEWIKDHFARALKALMENNVLESFDEVEELREEAMKKALHQYDDATEGISNRMRWSAIRWKLHGLDIRHSPFILQRIADGFHENLVAVDDEAEREKKPGFRFGIPRIPIPCAISQQIITESAAVMSGWWKPGMSVERGTIRRIPKLGVHVVHDLDFVANYENHGGCDMDDKFSLFYRTMEGGEFDGMKVVIVVRSPNGWGEYAIYKYVDGEEFPIWTKVDGTEVSFPAVNGNGWPMQLSVALRNGTTKYTGLPGGGAPPRNLSGQQYTRAHFIEDIEDSVGSGTVGAYVNARMLYALVMRKHRHEHLCSLEDAIDTYVQGGSADDRRAIDAAARTLVREVVASGRPIDRHFWDSRPGLAKLVPKNTPVNLVDQDYFSATLAKLNNAIRKFRNDVFDMGQTMRHVDPRVIELGNRFYHRAEELTEEWGQRIGEERHRGPGISIRWNWVFEPIAREFVGMETDTDRYDLALALAAVAHTKSTVERGYQDTIPCNGRIVDIPDIPAVMPFDWYLNAMRYYGICWDKVNVDDHERPITHDQRTEWTLVCVEDGNRGVVTDPMQVQAYHARGNRCTLH